MLYNTKQKELILNNIKKINGEFTIKDIYDSLNKKVGLTTIYRYINKLVLNGIVKKDNDKYSYLEECNNKNHFYLKCNCCGNVIHTDCECINKLSKHIYKNHKFVLNRENIIINGFCNKCSKE